MKIKILRKYIALIPMMLLISGYGQVPVTICESVLKLGAMSEENLYYSFQAGDYIVFDFEEINGKELKEIEIVELPSFSRYKNFRQSKVEDKRVYVNQKSVFQFRLKNGAAMGRVCKVKIQRIPKSDKTQLFNTGWKWETVYDTIYEPYTQDSLVGYDTLRYKETVKEEVGSSLQEEDLLPGGKPITIKSSGIIVHDNPRAFVKVTLPQNMETIYQTKKVIAWAYWIGVGESDESIFTKNKELLNTTVSSVVGFSNPIALFALGAVSDLIIPSGKKDNVKYKITNSINKELFMNGSACLSYDEGYGKGGVGRFIESKMCQGDYYICMYNENIHDRLHVIVRAVAVVEIKDYQYVEYDRIKINPRYVTLHKQRMRINTYQVRVPIE